MNIRVEFMLCIDDLKDKGELEKLKTRAPPYQLPVSILTISVHSVFVGEFSS